MVDVPTHHHELIGGLGSGGQASQYVATRPPDFLDVVEALARGGVGKGRPVDIKTAPNFLLFKSYTAAKQLLGHAKRPVAVIAIDDYFAWPRFRFTLENDFINWRSPRFLKAGKDWHDFLEGQKFRYQNIQRELSEVILTLDELWIVKKEAGFRYSLVYIAEPGSGLRRV